MKESTNGNHQGFIEKLKTLVSKPETWWLVGFSILPWLVGSALVIAGYENRNFLLVQTWPVWLLIFGSLSIPIAFSLIPNTLVGIFMGFLLGFKALPGMVVSFTLASIIGFFLGKRIDSGLRDTLFAIWPSWKKGFEKLKGNSFFLVFSFRLLPVPPFAVGNLLLAWFQIPFYRFLWASLLGMFPRMALVIWLGSHVEDLLFFIQHPGEMKELTWFSWGAFVMVLGLWAWMWKRLTQTNGIQE